MFNVGKNVNRATRSSANLNKSELVFSNDHFGFQKSLIALLVTELRKIQVFLHTSGEGQEHKIVHNSKTNRCIINNVNTILGNSFFRSLQRFIYVVIIFCTVVRNKLSNQYMIRTLIIYFCKFFAFHPKSVFFCNFFWEKPYISSST